MTPSNKKRILVIGSLILIGATVAYILYEKNKASAPPSDLPGGTDVPVGGAGVSTPGSTDASSPIKVTTNNPVQIYAPSGSIPDGMNSAQILSFQKFANTKGANLTVDGKWGPKTKSAWAQYGSTWQNIDSATGYDKGYVNAWNAAKKARQTTFTYNGKVYATATGKVYVVPIGGEGAIGKLAYPKTSFSNVRSAPRAADGILDNTMLGKVNSPNVIGRIKNLTFGKDKFRWYEVDIITPLVGPIPYAKTGWVREDSVIIKNG